MNGPGWSKLESTVWLRFLLGIVCTGLVAVLPARAHTDISPAVALWMIVNNEGVIVVDVREYAEFCGDTLHIEDAANLPWNSGILQARLDELPADADIIVVCASGNRSNAAATHLDAQGFTNVHDLQGGMSAWEWRREACDTDPVLRLLQGTSGAEINWTPTAGVQDYALMRGDLDAVADLITHVDLGPADCLSYDSPFTYLLDADHPTAGDVFFYLARSMDGSWGTSSQGQERIPVTSTCE